MKYKRTVAVIAAFAVIVLLIILQTGVFSGKDIPPGETAGTGKNYSGKTMDLKPTVVPDYFKTVGTVRSRDEIEISPRITARIKEVTRRSGDSIKKDEVLVKLDDADLKALRDRASEELISAQAALDRAQKDFERQKQLLANKAVSRKAYEYAEEALKTSLAKVAAAQQALKQAEANLEYATITSPMDAIVAERYVDPGDMGSPGNIMLKIFDPARLMLYVPLREGLVQSVKVGDKISFSVGALDKTYTGEVREIVPSVDPGSRTFMIKMCILGDTKQLMPGMFGTVEIKLGTKKVYIVPANAITRIGQLEYLTEVNIDNTIKRILVRTIPGPTPDTVQIVSGVAKDITIAVN